LRVGYLSHEGIIVGLLEEVSQNSLARLHRITCSATFPSLTRRD
jgi:hypothetical protein